MWLALAIAGLLFVPNLVWNAQHAFATFTHTAEISGLEQPTFSFAKLGEFAGGQFLVFGPLTFAGLLALPLLRGAVLQGARACRARVWFFGVTGVVLSVAALSSCSRKGGGGGPSGHARAPEPLDRVATNRFLRKGRRKPTDQSRAGGSLTIGVVDRVDPREVERTCARLGSVS